MYVQYTQYNLRYISKLQRYYKLLGLCPVSHAQIEIKATTGTVVISGTFTKGDSDCIEIHVLSPSEDYKNTSWSMDA